MNCSIHIYEKIENGKIIYCDDDGKEVILSEVHLIVRSEKMKSPIEEIPDIIEEDEEEEKPEYEDEYFCVSDNDDEYYGYEDIIPDELLNEK